MPVACIVLGVSTTLGASVLEFRDPRRSIDMMLERDASDDLWLPSASDLFQKDRMPVGAEPEVDNAGPEPATSWPKQDVGGIG